MKEMRGTSRDAANTAHMLQMLDDLSVANQTGFVRDSWQDAYIAVHALLSDIISTKVRQPPPLNEPQEE